MPNLKHRQPQEHPGAKLRTQDLSGHARIESRERRGESLLKAWPVLGILFIQSFLLSAHWLIYRTLVEFLGVWGFGALTALRVSLLVLGLSFVAAALLSFYLANALVRVFYTVAAVWLGFLNYFFFAAVLSWFAWWMLLFTTPHAVTAGTRPIIAGALFAVAAATGLYGLINARRVRTRQFTVRLPNLPTHWLGRTALVISDLHLGHINGARFSRRITGLAQRLNPDIMFFPGDVFDGTKADASRLAAPLRT